MPDRELLSWADAHHRELRLHAASLAQIKNRPEPHPSGDGLGQQLAWARRQARLKHLHDSSIAQLRHR